MKVEVFKGEDGQWYFRLIADNGEPLAVSEAHHNRIDVLSVLERYFPEWKLSRSSSF